jgi:citrate lyase subunit gamma (acyl carrier protein)
MTILKNGSAGTLESCDASVTIEAPAGPSADGGKKVLDVIVESATDRRFASRVRDVALATLAELGVENAKVVVRDRSALDCTVRARVITACLRAAGLEDIPWQSIGAKDGQA